MRDPEIERVQITALHHPLYGQSFEVVRRLSRSGESQLVIDIGEGRTLMIPARWTVPPQTPACLPTCTTGHLRALLRLVAQLSQEVSDAAPNRALDKLGSKAPRAPGNDLGGVDLQAGQGEEKES